MPLRLNSHLLSRMIIVAFLFILRWQLRQVVIMRHNSDRIHSSVYNYQSQITIFTKIFFHPKFFASTAYALFPPLPYIVPLYFPLLLYIVPLYFPLLLYIVPLYFPLLLIFVFPACVFLLLSTTLSSLFSVVVWHKLTTSLPSLTSHTIHF